MVRKKLYDHDRQEVAPPRVPEPWKIDKGRTTPFVLIHNGIVMKLLLAQSLDGAHREGMIFIKDMDF